MKLQLKVHFIVGDTQIMEATLCGAEIRPGNVTVVKRKVTCTKCRKRLET
jgi:hypothetical protein